MNLALAHKEWGDVRLAVNPLARKFGLYSAYQLDSDEYIANITFQNLHNVYDWLKSCRYEYNWLAAAKTHPTNPTQPDLLSMRKVPRFHPDVNARITREWEPNECQYHVHVFKSGDMSFEFYSHYEVRPDLFRPNFNPDRLRTHYHPEYGEDYLKGVESKAFSHVVR